MSKGVELADSFVVNPHKWMLTNFDCSAYYVRDKNALINTFSILPEYLKTPEDKLVNNYRDWGIPLGRRFRALKLWFVMRMYGQEGMQEIIRRHIALGQWLATEITKTPGFEIMAPVPLNLICFRLHPEGCEHEAELDKINQELLEKLNSSGKILLTQTRLNGKFVIRFVAGQENVQKEDIVNAWELIKYNAEAYLKA